MKCGYCEESPDFIDVQALKNHMVEFHPESDVAKQQNAGFSVQTGFSPDLSPFIMIMNNDQPVISIDPPTAMLLGLSMYTSARNVLDEFYLIRTLENNGVPEDFGMNLLIELRQRRNGTFNHPSNRPG